ncbi:MAG: F0F1 ATP synthase subunit A, partial [Fuerstiella sp.]|nr:F0F1 ATP synthase subunit A [Fuerstiella sp.]
MSAEHSDNFHHVRDFPFFELPGGMKVELPSLFGFQFTKFMVLQAVAAVLVFLIFRGLSKRIASGDAVKGRFWNFWEMLALFVRDEVVRPTIGDGHHDHDDNGGASDDDSAPVHGGHFADQYLPFIWSCFFYILICNLLGAIPFLGSATGSINVTGALALCSFAATCIYGVRAMGVGGFFGNLIPDTGLTGIGGQVLSVMMFLIEGMGFLIKHSILALRLFGNIMGGHTALGVMLAFIAQSVQLGNGLWSVVTVGSVAGQVGIGLLELLVAVLQ